MQTDKDKKNVIEIILRVRSGQNEVTFLLKNTANNIRDTGTLIVES